MTTTGFDVNDWMGLQQWTTAAATAIAALAAVVSTSISVMVFYRTRPNRTREAIDEALKPVQARITSLCSDVERLRSEQRSGERTIEEVENEIAEQLKEIDDKMDAQAIALGEMRVKLGMLTDSDQSRTLHHRVTEVAKAVSGLTSAQEVQGRQLSMIHQFLLDLGKNRA